MQILEHEEHRLGSGALRQQRQHLLEDLELRARLLRSQLPRISERPQGLDHGLVRQLCPDEVDRTPDEDLETRLAGSPLELRRESGLPDARFSGEEDGATSPVPDRLECACELLELAFTSDEHLARASLHLLQYRAASLGRRLS